jgi:hypothetical protein
MLHHIPSANTLGDQGIFHSFAGIVLRSLLKDDPKDIVRKTWNVYDLSGLGHEDDKGIGPLGIQGSRV